jgi:hypothetical protein
MDEGQPSRGGRCGERLFVVWMCLEGGTVDRQHFSGTDWWLVEPGPGDAVARARTDVGDRFGWFDESWYTDHSKLEELYNHLHSHQPQLLEDVDYATSDDQRVHWLHQIDPSSTASAPTGKPALTAKERANLERITGNELQASYTTLVGAVAHVEVKNLRKSIKKSPDVLSVIFQIAIGVALAELGGSIAELADAIPPDASNTVYRVALAAADEHKATEVVKAAYEVGKATFEDANARKEITAQDMDDKFLGKITDTYNAGINLVDASLSSLSDEDLGLLYISFSPKRLTRDYYVSQVETLLQEYKEEVEEVGDVEQESVLTGARQIRTLRFIVTDEPNNVFFLAAVDAGRGGTFFIEEVHSEVRQDAIDRWMESEEGKQLHEIPRIRVDLVQNVPERFKVSTRTEVPPQLKVSPAPAKPSSAP